MDIQTNLFTEKYKELESKKLRITYVHRCDKYENYYFIIAFNQDFEGHFIVNAYTADHAYRLMKEDYPNYKPKLYSKIPTEESMYSNDYRTGETQLINIYSRTKSGFKLVETVNHNILKGQTQDMIEHMYRKKFSNKYIQLISKARESTKKLYKEMEEKALKKQEIKLTKELRDETQASLSLCQKAIQKAMNTPLNKTEDDIKKDAYNILQKEKAIIGAKKDNNALSEFIIISKGPTHRSCLVKFGCQSEQGKKILEQQITVFHKIADIFSDCPDNTYIQDLLLEEYSPGVSVYTRLKQLSGDINERVDIVAAERINLPEGIENIMIDSYIHHNNKTGGVIIYSLTKKPNEDEERKLEEPRSLVHSLTQQMVFTNPLCIKENQLLPSIVEYEKKLIVAQVENEIKAQSNPEIKKNMQKSIENIIKGKINKFCKEVVLESQMFEFAGFKKESVKDVLRKNNIVLLDAIIV